MPLVSWVTLLESSPPIAPLDGGWNQTHVRYMKLFLLVLVAGLLAFAYFGGGWPFTGPAVANCLLTEKGATCFQFQYGWPARDALLSGSRRGLDR